MTEKSGRPVALVETDGAAEFKGRKGAQIMSAATRLFLKDGFDAVSMDMVAAKSGVSKSTLYAHYKDKKDLFAAVMLREAARANDGILSDVVENENVKQTLKSISENYYKVFMTDRAFSFKRAILAALPRFPTIGQIIFDAGPTQVAAEIAKYLERACERKQMNCSDAKLAATQFMALLRNDVEMRGLYSVKAISEEERNERIDVAIDMFLAAYRAEP